MPHSLVDPLLVKTKDAVESKLPPELKEPVNSIVVAGGKILYTPSTHEQIVKPVYDAIKAQGFQPEQIANGMVNLLGMVYKGSGGGMKVEAAYPAGVILLCYVLDDLEQLHALKVDAAMLKTIGSAMMKQFVRAFGIGQKQEAPAPDSAQQGAAPAQAAPGQQGTDAGMVQQGAV